MFVFSRKTLAGAGVAAAAIASAALLPTPAMAASTGTAKVVGSTVVEFKAASGKANSLVITISGRTVTLDDKVAIKAGRGCRAVRNDKTKVKCTTSRATKELRVDLGNKSDALVNKTSVILKANGGSGNDTITGGRGNDEIVGGTGNDVIDAGAGTDVVVGGAGDDAVMGGAGDDIATGNEGSDKLEGGAGDDIFLGDEDNDVIAGGDGQDILAGFAGDDTLSGDADDDFLVGEDLAEDGTPTGSDTALDVLDGGDQVVQDTCIVMAAGTTTNCEVTNTETEEPGLTLARKAAVTQRTADAVAAARAEAAGVAR